MIDGRIFAVYKGDRYIMDGTLAEIAEARGITLNSARFMTYPSYRKRVDERLKNNPNSECVTLTYVGGRRKREWPKHKREGREENGQTQAAQLAGGSRDAARIRCSDSGGVQAGMPAEGDAGADEGDGGKHTCPV